MQVVFITIYFKKTYTENNLLKDGWKKLNNKVFEKNNGNYKFTYLIKKGTDNSLLCVSLKSEENKYSTLPSFLLKDVWKHLWKQDTKIESLEIYTHEDILDILIEYGWEKVSFISNSNMYMYKVGIRMPYSYIIKDGYNILSYDEELNTDELFNKLQQAGINIS